MERTVPFATYRVQLTADFDFYAAAATLPYLAELGVSTLYCSPVLQARTGSSHGYDVTDPTRVSEELGGIEGWKALCEAAREHGMTLLLDIVPNHMAATVENPWWRDVLEHGRVSPYADVFDIDWMPADERPRNRVTLPILPQPLNEALDNGYLSVGLTRSGLVLQCGETALPLNVWSYRLALAALEQMPEGTVPECLLRAVHATSVVSRVSEMDLVTDRQLQYDLRCMLKDELMAHLFPPNEATAKGGGVLAGLVRRTLSELPRKQLRRILSEQCYALEYWKTGLLKLNYRRFFDVADLVGVRVENPDVFDLTHDELGHLAASGVVCGFRVDHIDGLRYPQRYLRRLTGIRVASTHAAQPRRPYLLVEKILSGNEALQPEWPIHGTTGYEFLNMLNGIFIDPTGLSTLERKHQGLTKSRVPRIDLVHRNKEKVCRTLFKGELLRLARLIEPLAPVPPTATRERIALIIDSLVAITARLPVYRTYLGRHLSMPDRDITYVRRAAMTAQSHAGTPEQYLYLIVVDRVLSLDLPSSMQSPRILKYCAEVARQWQQLSGAVMAKGFEDTTLYQDTVLLSLNEVGADHERSAISLESFHRGNARQLEHWPDSMNCTATHDTKRGEDARARLNVISEMSGDWNSLCSRWLHAIREQHPVVDASTALFLLQTIVSTWPENPEEVPHFRDRVMKYSIKVAREAKRYSNWIEPNEEYERALGRLVAETIDGTTGYANLCSDIDHFRRLLAFHGAVNSIAQVVLKATCPGVPDFYQGTELWDLSMVDPDNRRPVDYALRSRMVRETGDVPGRTQAMLCSTVAKWPDPMAKLHVTRTLLQLRKVHRDVFQRGSYEPVYADRTYRDNVCAYMRRDRSTWITVLVPVRTIALSGAGKLPLGEGVWSDSVVALPPVGPTTYTDAITGRTIPAKDGLLRLSEVFERFPAAVLYANVRRS